MLDLISPEKLFNHDSVILVTDGAASGSSRVKDTDDKSHALADVAEAVNGSPSGHGSVRACMVDDGADTQEQQRFTQDIAKLMKHVFTLVRAEHKHRFQERQRSIPSMNRNHDICYVVRLCA